VLHDVTCVEGACKESVQKIRENAGMRKAEERMKERKLQLKLRKAEGLSV
jgi:hypothetical protein